jgi:hypothetical protein
VKFFSMTLAMASVSSSPGTLERRAMRHGNYVAKLADVPVASAQRALDGTSVSLDDPDALRSATVSYLRDHDAE